VIYFCTYINAFLGNLLLLSDGQLLTGLYFIGQKHAPVIMPDWHEAHNLDIFSVTSTQLHEYTQRNRKTFTIPYGLTGATLFQKKVWDTLATIPYGSTLHYSQLAEHVGGIKKTRAVANATAHNPISLILPCHRVIGKSGSLTGYAGGLERKRALLALEQKSNLL
jgi:methylated-DNA-[protein]-cysteine S-methyltransferase